MSASAVRSVSEAVEEAVAAVDFDRVYREYWEQNECLFLKGFLARDVVVDVLAAQAEQLKPTLNRNYIPGLADAPHSARGAGGLPLVTLVPKPGPHESVQSMAKVVIEVQPNTYYLKTVAIYEKSGNVSTFEFTNLKANSGLKEDLFVFKVPPGVEVVQAPALGPP